jgi:hypothetical protein
MTDRQVGWSKNAASQFVPAVRLALLAVGAIVTLAAVSPSIARAEPAVAWRYEPAPAPPPPAGVAPAPYAVPLGEVGQISFWAPNRGLLITGGTQGDGGSVPAGLYAYDGTGWHLLSSVCGGAKGRIAWAGPDDFWTISDQRPGQALKGVNVESELPSRSLCHFVNGEVVGSYAMPLGEAGSYQEMDAAACFSAQDCWFGGPDGEGLQAGSFHLHWDGSSVSSLYDSSDHAVTGMAVFEGRLYEGLSIGSTDSYLPGEDGADPPVLRTIAPFGSAQSCEGLPGLFCNVDAYWEAAEQSLPIYPPGVLPYELAGFNLSTDGSALGAGATQLWAGADPLHNPPRGLPPASLTVLHDERGNWSQVLPPREVSGHQVESPLGEAALSGSSSFITPTRYSEPGAGAIAPVPGTESAWLSLSYGQSPQDESAVVALLQPDGQTTIEALPRPAEEVGFRGNAGPIACAAANNCWMATTEGWLFHLSDGDSPARDTDPFFDGQDGVIEYRPPDSGIPVIYPDGFAEDDSLANQQPPSPPSVPPVEAPASTTKAKKAQPLARDIKSSLLHRRVLVISFTLTARAHVQLIARKHQRIVAETRKLSLRPGSHRLSLPLDPSRWPTKVQFVTKPIGISAPVSSGSDGEDTVGT